MGRGWGVVVTRMTDLDHGKKGGVCYKAGHEANKAANTNLSY